MALFALTASEIEALEALVDRVNLATVVDALAYIAVEKAEHIEHNWQDVTTARPWRAAYKVLASAVTKLKV